MHFLMALASELPFTDFHQTWYKTTMPELSSMCITLKMSFGIFLSWSTFPETAQIVYTQCVWPTIWWIGLGAFYWGSVMHSVSCGVHQRWTAISVKSNHVQPPGKCC